MEFISDKPIEKVEEDQLGSFSLANNLAKSLVLNDFKDGFTIMLNGSWGDGKTSILNLTKTCLKEFLKSGEDVKRLPIIHDFSPWNVTSQEAIISEFFDCLAGGFTKEKIKKILKEIKGSNIYNAFYKIGSILPIISKTSAWKVIEKLDASFRKYVESFNNSKGLADRKRDIIDVLNNCKTKHIVFVDDLDRLNNAEIRLVFQLIKSVCNFPNVVYVIAADEKIVSSALKDEQGCSDSGTKYLDKIVQVNYDLPKIPMDSIYQMATSAISDMFQESFDSESINRMNTILSLGLFDSLVNVRDEKRFINYLSIFTNDFIDEFDISDFIAITYLKYKYPSLFDLLIEYSDYLFGETKEKKPLSNKEQEFKEKLYKITKNENVFRILKLLFPNLFIAGVLSQKSRTNNRICNKHRFNYYLTHQFDSEDFSLKLYEKIIKTGDYQQVVEFSKMLSPEQNRIFLQYLSKYPETVENISDCDFVFLFFFRYLPNVQLRHTFFSKSKYHYLLMLLHGLFEHFSQKTIYCFLKNYISSKNSLYSISEFLIDLSQDSNNKYQFTDENKMNLFKKGKKLLYGGIQNGKIYDLPIPSKTLRFLYTHKPESFIRLIKNLPREGKCRLIANLAYIGSLQKETESVTYKYDLEWIKSLFKEQTIRNCYRDFSSQLSEKENQRYIVLLMQLDNEEADAFMENEPIYSIDNIKKYCLKKHIKFIPSDEYEEHTFE